MYHKQKYHSTHSPMFAKVSISSPVVFICIASARACLSVLLRRLVEALKLVCTIEWNISVQSTMLKLFKPLWHVQYIWGNLLTSLLRFSQERRCLSSNTLLVIMNIVCIKINKQYYISVCPLDYGEKYMYRHAIRFSLTVMLKLVWFSKSESSEMLEWVQQWRGT